MQSAFRTLVWRVSIWLLVGIPSLLCADEYSPATETDIMKLVTAAWEPTPHSFQATYFKTIRTSEFNEPFHRKGLAKAIELSQGAPGNLLRTRQEQQAWLEDSIGEQRLKWREGERGIYQLLKEKLTVRWDFTKAELGEPLTVDTPFRTTYIQRFDPSNREFKGLRLSTINRKTADIYDDPRRRMRIDEPWDWGRFPRGLSIVFQAATCRQPPLHDNLFSKDANNENLQIDSDRLEMLRTGRHPDLKLLVKEEIVDGISCRTFQIMFSKSSSQVLELTCWKSDYSVVPRATGLDANTQVASVRMYASDYSKGSGYIFPKVVKNQRPDPAGGGILTEEIVVHAMKSPVEIDPAKLSFSPPKDYLVTDSRGSTPVIVQTPNQRFFAAPDVLESGRQSSNWFFAINVLLLAGLTAFWLVRRFQQWKMANR